MRWQARHPVKTNTAWSRPPARYRGLGGHELFMLVLSNLVIVVSGGLSLLWQLRHVHAIARKAPSTSARAQWLVVLGMHLRRGAIAADYALRLEKALALQAEDRRRRILILGGRRGAPGETEAEKGKQYLVGRGVLPSRILIEDSSSNTLENLRRARAILGTIRPEQAVLISNRYHLARAQWIAVGIGLSHTLCAAEQRLHLDARVLGRLLQEAYYLHWVVIGKAWPSLEPRRTRPPPSG